ncbi:MAG: hypothetical protein VKJ24_20685 [Synechococcales bacterium]|nr:hypothetical protein [Synechococcales bacterium]
MKRYNHLWPAITSFDNLLLAAKKAQRGKRFRENVLEFNHDLERNLLTLQQQLQAQTYQPGKYRTFEIFEPKPRIIAAAPYTDRVVHHALCNIIVPIFERTFIRDSYANRSGYGTHFALFADDRGFLAAARTAIEAYLATLRLTIHPIKSQLFETNHGANFVGFRILPNQIRVRGDSLQRGRKRFRKNRLRVLLGRMTEADWARSTQSWMAHLQHADSWRLRQAILAETEMPQSQNLG